MSLYYTNDSYSVNRPSVIILSISTQPIEIEFYKETPTNEERNMVNVPGHITELGAMVKT